MAKNPLTSIGPVIVMKDGSRKVSLNQTMFSSLTTELDDLRNSTLCYVAGMPLWVVLSKCHAAVLLVLAPFETLRQFNFFQNIASDNIILHLNR